MSRGAVFLDRDGVVNRAMVRDGLPFPPASLDELEIVEGTREACAAFRAAGLVVIVVSNQPDLARGTTTRALVDAINAELVRTLAVDEVVVCAHDDDDRCGCRKPAPGMLLAAAERWGVDLASSVMLGDRWRDIEAGRRAGMPTVFVDRGYLEAAPNSQDLTVGSLTEAVPWVLARFEAAQQALA